MRIARRAGVAAAVMLGWHALAFGQAYECTLDGKVVRQGMPCGTSTQAKSIPGSTSGVVYLRSDTIAYPANYVPAGGLPNAQISLSGNSTTTDAAGMFSIPSGTASTANPAPLSANLSGYIPTWYPWLPDDALQPIGIGVYPETAAIPRPGFVSGIIPHDMGGWLPGVYAQGLFAPTFDRIKDVAGGNLVVFVDPAWVTSYNVSTNSVTMGTGPLNANWGMASRSMYETIVGQAKARGLQFMMMLGIEPDGSLLNFHQTVGNIPRTNTAFWDAWFAAYRPLVLERTIIARDLGIEYVGLGFNIGYMSTLGVERWRSLIDAMRALGYKGKITYFGMTTGAFGETEFAHSWTPGIGPNDPMAFIRLFDVIGIDIYDGVTKTTPDEVLDRAQSRARIRSSLKSMLDRMSEAAVPIFVMVGTPSVHGGVSNSEYIEPCLPCNSLAPSRTRDYQQQADLYQALSEVINESATGNGRVMGFLSWGYHFRDDFTYGNRPGDSAYDKSASIRGKPAEAVLRSWFQRWATGTRPEVAAPAAIVGAWSTCTAPGCASVLVFLDNGTYYHIEDATAAQGPTGVDGFERGTYAWNPNTGAFTVITLKDTDGELGLSRLNALAGLTFNVAGDSAMLTIPGQSPVAATRVIDPSPIVGAWSGDNTGAVTDASVVVFFPNGTYLGMQDGVASGGGSAGIEHGTYVWDPNVRGYVVSAAPGVDTNGDWGLWPRPAMTMRVSADLRTVTFAENLRTSSATRVGAPDHFSEVAVQEFYAPSLNHYFRTANADEAAALDGNPNLGWRRTGDNFIAYARTGAPAGAYDVCRFYGSMSPGPNSHFYTADPAECAWLKTLQQTTPASQPRWNFEEVAFAVDLRSGSECPVRSWLPIYRAYNNRAAQGDSNHRYTADPVSYYALIAQGWLGEGVVMCAVRKG